jgi:hypothetical protein
MFTISGHVITPEQAAILLDDGLFRGVPAWGRTHEYIPPKTGGIELGESVKVHKSVVDLLSGGMIQIRDETALDEKHKDIIYELDNESFERGLNLFAENHFSRWEALRGYFRAGLDKATDLTQYGDAVIQLALFGKVKY